MSVWEPTPQEVDAGEAWWLWWCPTHGVCDGGQVGTNLALAPRDPSKVYCLRGHPREQPQEVEERVYAHVPADTVPVLLTGEQARWVRRALGFVDFAEARDVEARLDTAIGEAG